MATFTDTPKQEGPLYLLCMNEAKVSHFPGLTDLTRLPLLRTVLPPTNSSESR